MKYAFLILLLSTAAHAQDTLSHKELKTVTISAQKPLIERRADRTIMNIANSTLSAGNNALDILNRAPGVVVDPNGTITMRGRSGVTVMLNGKLTYLSGEQLLALLRATPSSSIQSIELITNPSARYDASSTAGIINIKTKKDSNFGTNGEVSISGSKGKFLRTQDWLSLNHRTKYYNFYGSYNYSNEHRWRDLKIDRVNSNAGINTTFNQHTNEDIKERNHNYKAGADFFLDKYNTLGIMISGYQQHAPNTTNSITNISSNPGMIDSVVNAYNPVNDRHHNTAYNINFRNTADSSRHELSIDLDYIKYRNEQNAGYNNRFYNSKGIENGMPVIFNSQAPSQIQILAAQLDYTRNFKNTKLEAGAKSSFVHTDNNFVFVPDSSRSNHFIYDENIHAAYVTAEHTFHHTSINLGMRAEQTNTKGNSTTLQQITTQHYLNFFPSLFILQSINSSHEIGFSWSRKINRPNYNNLNPFTQNFDLYTLSKGNPYLTPEYTHNFELSYSYKKQLNVALNYSMTNHAITEVTLPDTINKTLFVWNQNIANKRSLSLNISAPLQPTKWWHMENNVTVFYNRFSTPELLGQPFSGGLTAVNVYTYQSFQLGPDTNIDLNFLCITPQVQGTYHIGSFYYGDLGFKQSFLSKKLTLKLAVDDFLNTHKERIHSIIPGQIYQIYQKYDDRVFHLALTYRFGSRNIAGSRQRTRSSWQEEQRTGH